MEINRYFIAHGEILYSRKLDSTQINHLSLLKFIKLKSML